MLSVVSTPIGNLSDITVRALETLKKVDAIVCEDTRVTGNLLKQLDIPKKELISMHGYSDPKKIQFILDRLKRGEHLALVSDAGTPGISDPGYALVSAVHAWNEKKKLEFVGEGYPSPTNFISIEVIPGASAFLAALSGSGLPIHQFLYLGFLPLKKGRKTLLESFKEEERTIVFYESVHRIEKTLMELAEALESQPERPIVIARELTKIHESVIEGSAPVVADYFAQHPDQVRGEFVVVVSR